jgi:16S rRNA (guanine527-N7)-methyltransferase
MRRDEGADPAGKSLNDLLAEAGMAGLKEGEEKAFQDYLSLFVRWNSRVNLSSVRDPEQIVSRHFIESIACARNLPEGIATLLDFGSGGGFPGIPITICRPDIRVTLAESQSKKSAFLQEAVRTLTIPADVFPGRAETLDRRFNCVTLRAVDNMKAAVSMGAHLVEVGGWLALMTTSSDAAALEIEAGQQFEWQPALSLPRSENRVLVMAQRAG